MTANEGPLPRAAHFIHTVPPYILNPPLDRSQNFVSDGQFPNHALNSHIKRVNFETKTGIS